MSILRPPASEETVKWAVQEASGHPIGSPFVCRSAVATRQLRLSYDIDQSPTFYPKGYRLVSRSTSVSSNTCVRSRWSVRQLRSGCCPQSTTLDPVYVRLRHFQVRKSSANLGSGSPEIESGGSSRVIPDVHEQTCERDGLRRKRKEMVPAKSPSHA
jgi:hypothetical protein